MFVADIKKLAKENTYFRHVLFTRLHSQVVVMSLLPGEDIGMEVHETSDQILYIIEGSGEAIVDNEKMTIDEHTIIVIPSGKEHNIINTGKESMKLFTVYAPPIHEDGIIHKTKADAQKENE